MRWSWFLSYQSEIFRDCRKPPYVAYYLSKFQIDSIKILGPFLACFGNCSWKESIFWALLIFLRTFMVCFGSFWNKSVCFSCFEIHPKHRNKLKQNKELFCIICKIETVCTGAEKLNGLINSIILCSGRIKRRTFLDFKFGISIICQ